MKRYVRFRMRSAALAAVAVVVVVLVGTAAAGPAGAVKTFTGCLVTGDGVIVKVKEGDSPKSACSSGQTLARLSGGDITKISVTGGLTLTNSGESGDVEINLDAKYSLPQGCADGRIAEWDTAPDPDRWICGIDSDTTYTNGTGLVLDTAKNPDEFNIDPDYRVKNSTDCTDGTFATGFDSSGVIRCSTPSAGIGDGWTTFGTGDAPEGSDNKLASLNLQAGNYLVIATGFAADDGGGDDELDVRCRLTGGTGADVGDSVTVSNDASPIPESSIALNDLAELSQAAEVYVECRSFTGSDNAAITLTAITIGSVNP